MCRALLVYEAFLWPSCKPSFRPLSAPHCGPPEGPLSAPPALFQPLFN
jgi:hypothetical protein